MITGDLVRHESSDKQTLGRLTLCKDGIPIFNCHTLELPWRDNAVQKSCIPLGTYNVIPRYSAKFKKHFHVLDVPGRSYILFHHGNYHTDILGCILVGKTLSDLNKDGHLDVTSSKDTMSALLAAAPDGFTLFVTE